MNAKDGYYSFSGKYSVSDEDSYILDVVSDDGQVALFIDEAPEVGLKKGDKVHVDITIQRINPVKVKDLPATVFTRDAVFPSARPSCKNSRTGKIIAYYVYMDSYSTPLVLSPEDEV